MTVGALAAETIALKRALECERDQKHEWKPYTSTEEQCSNCAIVATPEGKKNLAKAAERFYGRRAEVERVFEHMSVHQKEPK